MSWYGNYNEFFNENICHVCKEYSGDMITCDKCRKITYCGQEHREIHSPQHMQICEAVQKFRKNVPHSDICFCRAEDWIQLKKEYINFIKQELSRELQPYEIQMIMVDKSCLVCHQQVNLYTCPKCCSANLCIKHINMFKTVHDSCKELEIYLEICKHVAAETDDVPLFKFCKYPDSNRNDTNMYTFINLYVRSRSFLHVTYIGWTADHFLYSEYVSNPLTLLHGMSETKLLHTLKTVELQQRKSYIIHIIGSVDVRRLSYWELFLHYLPDSTHLKIILIGMELPNCSYDIENLCFVKCYKGNRKLTINVCSMLYHDYVSSEEYMPPNLIIGFHIDICNGDICAKTILALQTQNCPLLLTSESERKIQYNLYMLGKVLNTSLNVLHHWENKYHSLRPYKNYETGDVFYSNKYLMMFRNLHGPSFS